MAILLDATVVRLVLVPATMSLLGDRNWWLPAWLDRVLPRLDPEGHAPWRRTSGPRARAGSRRLTAESTRPDADPP